MFKKLALICGLALLVSANSFALGIGGKDLKVSTGYFSFSDSDVKDVVGTAFALNAEKALTGKGQWESFVSVGYAKASGSNGVGDGKITIIPMVYGMKYNLTPNALKTKFYAGAGAGLTYSNAKATYTGYTLDSTAYDGTISETWKKLSLSFQLMGGVEFGKSMFAEMKYIDGGEDVNTGWSFCLGAKF